VLGLFYWLTIGDWEFFFLVVFTVVLYAVTVDLPVRLAADLIFLSCPNDFTSWMGVSYGLSALFFGDSGRGRWWQSAFRLKLLLFEERRLLLEAILLLLLLRIFPLALSALEWTFPPQLARPQLWWLCGCFLVDDVMLKSEFSLLLFWMW